MKQAFVASALFMGILLLGCAPALASEDGPRDRSKPPRGSAGESSWALDEIKAGVFHPCSLDLSWLEGDARGLECDGLAASERALGTILDGDRGAGGNGDGDGGDRGDGVGPGSSSASGVKAARRLRRWRKERASRIQLSTEYSPCLAKPGARVTIFAFMDYDCGYCKAVRYRLLDLVQRASARVCVKQYPTAIMERYPVAALATVAAHQQGSFLDMFDALYERDGDVEEEDVIALAREMDLEVERFRTDLASAGVRAVLLRDVTEGGRIGVRGTPTLVAGSEVFTDFEVLEDWVAGLLDEQERRKK